MVAMAKRYISKRMDAVPSCPLRMRTRASVQFEPLESRTLLAATLYVSAPGVPTDATHFDTLQAALVVATSGDTIYLQPGFSMGAFNSATLVGSVAAGETMLRVTNELAAGQVVSIGATSGADPLERALVTAVTPTLMGDFLVTVATPLLFAHTNSPISGTNASTSGPTIGIATGLTLAADPAAGGLVTLPFSLELWKGVSGITISDLALTTAPATSLYINGSGNTLSNLAIANQVVLTNAGNNTLAHITVGNRLFVDTGSSGNLFTDSTFNSVQLRSGSHHNTFLRNAIAGLKAFGVGDTNGGDLFQANTFTGNVTIVGNTHSPTLSAFLDNTFTLTTGKPLILENAGGTVIQGNLIVTAGSPAITVHNSADLLIAHNTLITTASRGTGIYAYADGTGATSLDIRNNTITTGVGIAIEFGKYDATASLETRLQENDLRNNATGILIWGDGDSAGNIDLGGGSTRFGASAGKNDFTSFTTSDFMNFAIGLFNTSGSHTVRADNNLWSVPDPLAIVADGSHTPDAWGSGIITAAVAEPAPVEELSLAVSALVAVQTSTTSGVVAHFTSSFDRLAGDFAATVAWGDGTSSTGIVVANAGGGFDILASHLWTAAGSFAVTVTIVSAGGVSIEQSAEADIAARTVVAQGQGFTIDKLSTFSGIVATFADNLPGMLSSDYVASVAWSDGVSTPATIVKNADGTFSVLTSRGFSSMGVMIGSVSVATLDGAFHATTNLTATITNKNNKVPGPKDKHLQKLAAFVTTSFEKGQKEHKAKLKHARCLR